MTENGKRWLRFLFLLLGEVVLFFASLVVEMSLRPDKETGAVVTVLLAFGMALVTVVVLIRNVVKTISSLVHKDGEVKERKHSKAKYYVIMVLQMVFSTVLVMVVGKREIDAFYARPDHIGFAIPIVSFLLAALMFLVTLVVVGICLFLALRKPKDKN